MTWFESIILGLVQGLTEFLPISSSAHLRLTAVAAGWPDPGAAFTAVAQIGTETAVLIYFRKDIVRIVTAWAKSLVNKEARRDFDAKMGWLVIIGSIPIGVLGLTLKDYIAGPFRDLRLIAFSLITLGIILAIADRYATRAALRAQAGGRHRAAPPVKDLEHLTVRDGLIYGLCQALALIPGMSRSGSTITGGLFLGYNRAAAARYSFLLAIPAVLASGAYELTEIGEHGSHVAWGPTIMATVVGGLVGYAVIAWFMKFISTRSFLPFVLYRVALGTALLVLIWLGWLDPLAGSTIGG
ncbi:undecaprenyl-diphosphate phosphatase [Streptomyces cavourensis]|uniref:undecaprenyl-diphosphate phosphatase n=1 Tax=Streptomyces TaxID=1883 RepID=UPI000BF00843|nr:undecaprenyl-diphosphate phosphatase [Streptomyces sp. st115]WTF40482.1 undecaprenyl-diphosphate phosphatase [Streptomyces cyaneofuscatus]